jgi:hypothetical protein
MSSISPDHHAVGVPVDVTVTGGKFIDAGQYECFFNSVMYPASWSSYTTVVCHLNSTVGYVPSNVTLYYNGQVYVNNSKHFEFFGIVFFEEFSENFLDCYASTSQGSCGLCGNNPSQYCGWCLNTFSCVEVEACNSSFWVGTSCPGNYRLITSNITFIRNIYPYPRICLD